MASPVLAQPRRAESVLVLEAPNEARWEPGVQAIVAELITTGYGLSVRAAQAPSLDQLERELQLQVAASAALAGVAVTRVGDDATAVLCHQGVSPCERLRMKISDGELSRSRLALAVVERLRPIDLPAASEPPPASSSDVLPLRVARAPMPIGAGAAAAVRPFRGWLSGGVVLSPGVATPLPWLTASLAAMPVEQWGVELCLGGSPFAGKVETDRGSLALRGFSATALGTFEPVSRGPFGFSLGLGGGALWLQETPSPAPGFDVSTHRPIVGVVSARARVFRRFGPAYLGLTIDPGVLVPALKVEAGADASVRIGRPWMSMQASVGFTL